ncbi:methionyl-tRNA formyltransferase [Candidatus Omnitrophota bacterium]
MNVVFMGSSKFAVPSLKAIIASKHKVICVVTQPDRQKGRGLALSSTEANKIAQAHKLRIYQPEDINTQESIEFLSALAPDIFAVVAFGQILSREVLAVPKILCLNLHASLLPKYRGAAPARWAIIKGESRSGVTVIKMEEKLDAGPIILQKEVDIENNEDAVSLEERLAQQGSGLLCQALDLIQDERHKLIFQDEGKVSFAPKLKKEDALIHWDKPAVEILNLIRGTTGWPGAFSYYQGKILKIHKANIGLAIGSAIMPAVTHPGVVLDASKKGIVVATGAGNLLITELQIEGKKRVTASEFISGYKFSVGDNLGKKN